MSVDDHLLVGISIIGNNALPGTNTFVAICSCGWRSQEAATEDAAREAHRLHAESA